jgi:hypothetical protein
MRKFLRFDIVLDERCLEEDEVEAVVVELVHHLLFMSFWQYRHS